jgi:hypothetical protein
VEVTEGEEDSTEAVAEGFTVAEDFMEVAGERFAGAEVSAGEAALGSAADARSADFVEAASIEVAAVSAGAAGASAGAEGIGAEDTVGDGAGDLALGGRIGVGDGDIRMATTTVPGIMGQTRMILTRTTVLRTIPRAILIPTTGTAILHQQITAYGPGPTRTDRQDPGDHRYREAERMQTTETATPGALRRVGRLSPLTG